MWHISDIGLYGFSMALNIAGFTQVREKSGKILFPQGQGKVREF